MRCDCYCTEIKFKFHNKQRLWVYYNSMKGKTLKQDFSAVNLYNKAVCISFRYVCSGEVGIQDSFLRVSYSVLPTGLDVTLMWEHQHVVSKLPHWLSVIKMRTVTGFAVSGLLQRIFAMQTVPFLEISGLLAYYQELVFILFQGCRLLVLIFFPVLKI